MGLGETPELRWVWFRHLMKVKENDNANGTTFGCG
jgi:hypothetical protein